MTAMNSKNAVVPDAGTLATLRALAAQPPRSIDDALRATDKQAAHLRSLLPDISGQALTSLTDLIPSIIIEHDDDIPAPGISFWAGGHWHMHTRASDPVDIQNFTVLHELKHIIDHPLRRRTTALSDIDWEALANHFAARVFAHTRHPASSSPGRP